MQDNGGMSPTDTDHQLMALLDRVATGDRRGHQHGAHHHRGLESTERRQHLDRVAHLAMAALGALHHDHQVGQQVDAGTEGLAGLDDMKAAFRRNDRRRHHAARGSVECRVVLAGLGRAGNTADHRHR